MTPGIKVRLYAGSQRAFRGFKDFRVFKVFKVFRDLGILNILFYINHKSL